MVWTLRSALNHCNWPEFKLLFSINEHFYSHLSGLQRVSVSYSKENVENHLNLWTQLMQNYLPTFQSHNSIYLECTNIIYWCPSLIFYQHPKLTFTPTSWGPWTPVWESLALRLEDKVVNGRFLLPNPEGSDLWAMTIVKVLLNKPVVVL